MKIILIGATLFAATYGVFGQSSQKLEELELSKIAQTYSSPSKNGTATGEALTVARKSYTAGIGIYAPSTMKLNLSGKALRFSALVGVTDTQLSTEMKGVTTIPLADGKRMFYLTEGDTKQFIGVEGKEGKIDQGSVIFKLIGDGKEIYRSEVIRQGEAPHKIDLNVEKINLLELNVEDARDGVSGDAAAWIDPVITYEQTAPIAVDITYTAKATVNTELTNRLLSKSRTLAKCTLPLPITDYDWLIDKTKAKATVMQTVDGKDLVLTNGLVARVFRITPSLATMDIVNLMNGENLLRAVSSEGEIEIDNKKYSLGGLDGQFEYGYIQYKWVDNFVPTPNSFIITDFEISPLTPRIEWMASRWASSKNDVSGKVITFTMQHNAPELKGVTIKLHYALYDGIPTFRKWMEIENDSSLPVTINTFKLEQLAMAEPESPVELELGDPRFLKPNIHIESDWAFRGFTAKEADVTEYWETDPRFTSQCNYPMVTPCLLEVKLPMGPGKNLTPQETFTSFNVWEMPFDSYDRERKGMFIKQMYRKISPWLTENPIFMHCTSSDPEVVKTAVNQCAETGYEMVILSFGSGLNMEDESEANYAKFKALNDYAESKGVQLGGYSLLSSRWISDEVDVINPLTGKRGGMIFGSSPCLSSEWGYDYFRKIKKFFEKTGMKVFENDGSYPGNVCASTTHAHHKGLKDSQWEQRNQISELYKWMCENGIYTNIPDFGYMHNGGTKVGIGYREVNWSLPRERQLVLGRQVNYDGTWERLSSMCWTFVPLTQYHGGGEAATLEPLSEHLNEYEGHMMQNYGAGIQACYRGFRLYDTDETKAVVKRVIDWYKKYRDILNSDLLHLRRADGRNYDGFVHINPSLETKGMVMLFNPLNEPITRKITLPLYYTGLTTKAVISEKEGKPTTYKLNRDYTVTINVTIPEKGYTWLSIQ